MYLYAPASYIHRFVMFPSEAHSELPKTRVLDMKYPSRVKTGRFWRGSCCLLLVMSASIYYPHSFIFYHAIIPACLQLEMRFLMLKCWADAASIWYLFICNNFLNFAFKGGTWWIIMNISEGFNASQQTFDSNKWANKYLKWLNIDLTAGE